MHAAHTCMNLNLYSMYIHPRPLKAPSPTLFDPPIARFLSVDGHAHVNAHANANGNGNGNANAIRASVEKGKGQVKAKSKISANGVNVALHLAAILCTQSILHPTTAAVSTIRLHTLLLSATSLSSHLVSSSCHHDLQLRPQGSSSSSGRQTPPSPPLALLSRM
ncbi:hypothetical protein K504DRAFT_464707 [Pleomassaria siparia CBS 279.74]|uniref:Uncharacterized protein n=1 Tax=Pleomassaria siparia CBS 279.74 TaxID=1314801 RepID=A0A6G1KIH8_9PLEO|nr:hypothetical protein K504DRAFT_464707 [Pleomassaria siparia CBS 279.74]